MTEERDTLKACPFCGTRNHLFIEPTVRGSGGQWLSPIHAGCSRITGCGVSRSGDDTDEAIALWNTRATDTLTESGADVDAPHR